MTRSLLVLLLGAAAGAGAVYWGQARDTGAPSGALAAPPAGAAREAPSAPAPPDAGAALPAETVAERAALYRLAADADERAIERLVARARREPSSAARDAALDVLLERYVELAPAQAVETARELGLPPERLARLHAAWASASPARALAALGALRPAEVEPVAAAVLDALGNDEAAFDQVLGALPASVDEGRLRAALLGLRAERAPQAALEAALEIEGPSRAAAIARVAASWAGRAPRAALDAADGIPDQALRAIFRARAVQEWTRTDPEAAVAYVAEQEPWVQQQFLAAGGLSSLAQTDPQRVLALADRLPASLQLGARSSALQTLAMSDPQAALRYVDSLPPGPERQSMLQRVAAGWAARDPDGALAWARGLDPVARGAVEGQVLGSLAGSDPDRAIDGALALAGQGRLNALRAIAMNVAGRGDASVPRVAERLLALGDAQAREMTTQMFFSMWSSRDPVAAADWVLARGGSVPASTFAALAQPLAMNDPQRAVAYTPRVPAEARGPWIAAVATGYARSNPDAALEWVEQYRGDPAFGAALSSIVRTMAQTDPRRAAEVFASLPKQPGDPSAFMIAGHWAQSEPAAAAQWAASLDADVRAQAVRQVTQQWAGQDFPGARDWVLRMPAGAPRDESLTALLQSSPAYDALDSVVAAFSDGAARNRGVMSALQAIAMRSPDQARAAADRFLTDAGLRRQAEQLIESATNMRMGMQSSVGIASSPANGIRVTPIPQRAR